MKTSLLIAVLLAGCATTPRFVDRPILWRDPDAAPIGKPKPQSAGIQWTGFRDGVVFPVDRALSLDYGEESWNVNAFDEVPDSSWFVDIRRTSEAHTPPRSFSAEEISRGSFGDDPVLPFTVIKGKAIGSTPGLVAVDATGKKYMLKLDPPGWLGLNTSTEVVATRLAWAAGWLVPAEEIVEVTPEDLLLSPKAKSKDTWGSDIALTPKMLADLIEKTPRGPNGKIRVCVSRWLDGDNIGPWAYTGRRADDPNDRIDHQNRRDVRAFGVFAAWLNDIDTMENNTMDAYVGSHGKGHVVHYQQDVGGSFGQFAAVPNEVWMGDETYFMPGRIFGAFFTFGFTSRSWDSEERDARRKDLMHKYPELGYFDDVGFNPENWHPILDNPAFVRQTARDKYWGAKRVVAFSETEIRAAVALGHYPPATEKRLVEILLHRREAIGRAFLREVAALDYFEIANGRLRFHDLWVETRLGGRSRYSAAVDGMAIPIENDSVGISSAPGYHIVTLSVARGEKKPQAVQVHYVVDGTSAHVIGVDR